MSIRFRLRVSQLEMERVGKKHNRKSLTANRLQQINIAPNLFESVNFELVTN